jgi:hypothetical protein
LGENRVAVKRNDGGDMKYIHKNDDGEKRREMYSEGFF